MPLLLAQALFNNVKDNKLALKLASGGFRDMTRLATSNLEMAEDMRNFNDKNISEALDILASSINTLKNTKDFKIFAEIKSMRSSMYSSEGKNIF
jgi:prephenate dehydrogenase